MRQSRAVWWMQRSQKGFTLMELMIVIAILGLLVTLSMTAYSGYRRRSVDAATKFCVQATDRRLTDIRYYATTGMARPQAGSCPASL